MPDCPIKPDDHRRPGFVQYLRKPDADFWLELLRPPPTPGKSDALRRERVTRYALGAATVFSILGTTPAIFAGPTSFLPAIVVNVVAACSYGIGMWMASLGKHDSPRVILLVTMILHIALLQWLLGNTVLVVVFVPLIALLARVLIPVHRRYARGIAYVVIIALLATSLLPVFHGVLDFTGIPDYLLAMMRIGNVLIALGAALLLLDTFEREVLRSETELETERERSDRLLHAVLPVSIATQLRRQPGMIADRHPQVTVLFADIAGFTPWSANREPEEVIAMLEKIFSRFDRLVEKLGVEKIKTIGDAYMVIAGAPGEREDHARVIAELGLLMLRELEDVRTETGLDIDLRVGIHTGPVIAGVIGSVRFSYDVWGDTVNTASRMESHGAPGRIQVSGNTYEILRGSFSFESRGEIEVKGKGVMETYWLQKSGG